MIRRGSRIRCAWHQDHAVYGYGPFVRRYLLGATCAYSGRPFYAQHASGRWAARLRCLGKQREFLSWRCMRDEGNKTSRGIHRSFGEISTTCGILIFNFIRLQVSHLIGKVPKYLGVLGKRYWDEIGNKLHFIFLFLFSWDDPTVCKTCGIITAIITHQMAGARTCLCLSLFLYTKRNKLVTKYCKLNLGFSPRSTTILHYYFVPRSCQARQGKVP